MPNWCYNYATFSHKDPEQVKRLVNAVKEHNLFTEFVPCPSEIMEHVEEGENYNERCEAKAKSNLEKYGYSGWYDWNCGNWGTKWDIGNPDVYEESDGSAVCSFDTAWGPPIAFYEKMVDMGWEVDAEYTEEGMGFVGYFTNEEGDECFDLNFDAFDEDWKDNFPERLHERIQYQYDDWLEWQEEENKTFKDEIGC